MQMGSSFKHAPISFTTHGSLSRPKCFAFWRNSFFTLSDAPGRSVETATRLDLNENEWERRLIDMTWLMGFIFAKRETHVSPFVSHKCNSPNMPHPSFSTMTNLSRGNSLSGVSSSMSSVSNSLYELRWWLSGVVGVMHPFRPSKVAVEFEPLLFVLLWLLFALLLIVLELLKRCPFIVPVLLVQICVAA